MTNAVPEIAEAVRRYAAAMSGEAHAEFALVRADEAHRKGQGIGRAILVGMDAIDFLSGYHESKGNAHG